MTDRQTGLTERARNAIFSAREEAGRLNSPVVGTEHLLLGLLREVDSLAARVLKDSGVELAAVRSAVAALAGSGQETARDESRAAPRMGMELLDLALREAQALQHSYIGTEHFLLGLVRELDGRAATVLTQLGADPGRIEEQIVRLLSSNAGQVQTG